MGMMGPAVYNVGVRRGFQVNFAEKYINNAVAQLLLEWYAECKNTSGYIPNSSLLRGDNE